MYKPLDRQTWMIEQQTWLIFELKSVRLCLRASTRLAWLVSHGCPIVDFVSLREALPAHIQQFISAILISTPWTDRSGISAAQRIPVDPVNGES
jgi:hypothetical protein